MRMGFRLLIAFGAVLIVLGAFLAVKFELFKPEAEESRFNYESTVERLTDIEEANVERILVDTENSQIVYIPAGEEGKFTIEMDYPVDLQIKQIGYAVDSLINLFASRVIEENPEDLSVYGFDNPILKVRILEKDGTVSMITAGSTSPDKSSYYVQVLNDPKVYLVSSYYLDRAFNKVNDYRPKEMPQINLAEMTYLKVKNDEVIEMVPLTEADRDARNATFSSFKIIQPYRVPKEMDSQFLEALYPEYIITPQIINFIEDNPSDFDAYGLGKNADELYLMDKNNSLHLLIGSAHDANTVYAKYVDEPFVFTVKKDVVALKDITAFQATAKNIMLVNIEACDNFSVTVADGRKYNMAITRTPDPENAEEVIETFMINGIPIDEKPFKNFYQKVIGISAHALNPDYQMSGENPFIDVTYYLNTKEGATVNMRILTYDRNFYAVYAFGEATFLTAKEEIDKLLNTAEELLNSE